MSRLGITAKVDNQKQVVNVNPINNINVSVRSPAEVQESPSSTTDEKVVYPAEGIYISPTEENVQALTKTNLELNAQKEALKIIIQMFKSNPLYVNNLLLVDDVKLSELIKLLTSADEVTIDCDGLGDGCLCGANTYRKVNAIYVIKDGSTKNLKYDYPDITKELKDLGINTKVVW